MNADKEKETTSDHPLPLPPQEGDVIGKLLGLEGPELYKNLLKPRIKVGNEFVTQGRNKDQVSDVTGQEESGQSVFVMMMNEQGPVSKFTERRNVLGVSRYADGC